MEKDVIYLDHNATTPPAPEVVDAMSPYMRERFGNPSSDHLYGRRARAGMRDAREEVAELIGAEPEEVIFTGSGTEANNIAVRGGYAGLAREDGGLARSAIEHPSVEQPCRLLEDRGVQTYRVGVDSDGRTELGELEYALEDGARLVSVMHANNETGVVQPVRAIVECSSEYGALVHTDASQTVGKLDVDVEELGVDLLTVTGHKFYGPKGVGALYVRRGVDVEPVLRGASHERGLRPGTENVPAVVGLGAACSLARARLPERRREMERLRDRLWRRLDESRPGVTRHGGEPTLPNTLNIRFHGVRGDALLEAVDGVAASTGSACHESGAIEPSGVLTAMGIEPDAALGAIRLSLGETTTEAEIDRAAEELVRAARELAG